MNVFFYFIQTALSTKRKEEKSRKRNHWLDYAEERYGKQLVQDTKVLLKILVLYIPLPLFWALFDQQGSRWTFQATRMDGDIGFYEIKPDQMQVINPFLILVFIPLYEAYFYPLLSKFGIRRPLQKLTAGGILAGVAFLISGLVELELEKTYPVRPGDLESQFRVFNSLPCEYKASVDIPDFKEFTIKSMAVFEEKHIKLQKAEHKYTYKFTPLASATAECPPITGDFKLESKKAMSVFLSDKTFSYEDEPNKARSGNPVLRILANTKATRDITIRSGDGDAFTGNTTHRDLIELPNAKYNIYVNSEKVLTIDLRQGSVNTIILRESDKIHHSVIEIASPNSLTMLWLIPQYVVMTLGEVMFSVTGLEFSYSQAPASMKSVLQACWLLTVAVGNVIVVAIAGAQNFSSRSTEFFLYAGLMLADMLVFMYLAYRYKSVLSASGDDSDTGDLRSDDDTKVLTDSSISDKESKKAAVERKQPIIAALPVNQTADGGKVNEAFKGD